jgi:uncharacterized protein (DUF305 family)
MAMESGLTGPVAEDPAADHDDVAETDDTDDVIVLPWWQNPRNIVTMLVTMALVAGMAGWLIGHERNAVESSDVDVGFLQDMRAHHEQAIEMSLTFLGLDDVDPQLVPIARSIAFGQGMEIGVMIQLLREMGAPTESDEGQAMAWMGMPMNDADMPGMASDDELDALSIASGAEADRQFVDLMTAHHEGGLEMLDHAAEHASNDDVRMYAAAWAGAQRSEIAELEALAPDDT